MTRAWPVFVAASWLFGAGCGASARPGAPLSILVRADAGLVSRPGYSGGGSLGFETNGCCGFGAYVGYWGLPGEAAIRDDSRRERADDESDATGSPVARPDDGDEHAVDRILDGGLELEVQSPWLSELRLRARGGFAGTPPTTVSRGRRGLAASLALVYRISGDAFPNVGEAAPVIDLLVGAQSWSFEAEYTSAGADDSSISGAALIVGVRIGGAYGLELR